MKRLNKKTLPSGKDVRLRTALGAIWMVLASLATPWMMDAAESPSYYRAIHDAEYNKHKTTLDSMAASNHGTTYYTFQYALGGTLSIFEATSDRKYLERALVWAETMLSKAAIVDKNGNLNWGGDWSSNPYTASSIAYQLDDLQGSTELTRLARIVLADPALKSAYGGRAEKVYNFVRDHIVNKHLYKRGGLSWFYNNARDTSQALSDKVVLLIRVLLDVKLASDSLSGTDNAAFNYPNVLSTLANGYKDHNGAKPRFEAYKGGLIWDKGLGFEGHTCVDTSHANRYPWALQDLHRASVVFTRDDVMGVANLFTKVIWNQSLASPMFTNFIDGSNGTYRTYGAWQNGTIYGGWPVLGQYDPKTLEVMDATLKAIANGVRNPSLDRMDNLHGRLALSGHLAKAADRVGSDNGFSPAPPRGLRQR